MQKPSEQDDRPELEALRALARLLARQAAAEQLAASHVPSSSLSEPKDEEDHGA